MTSTAATSAAPGAQAGSVITALRPAPRPDQPGPLEVTNPRHFDGRQSLPLSQVRPQVILSSNPMGNLDDNSVDLEKEMVKLGENQVVYQAYTQMVALKFAELRMSIREGEF